MERDTFLFKLSNTRYISRVKCNNPGKGIAPFLHLGEVAIEKGAFWLPSTTVANFTFFYLLLLFAHSKMVSSVAM